MLLTDEEISEIAISNPPDVHKYARAIEAAILAKLASAELPEPADRFVFSGADWHRATPEYFKQSLGQTNCIAAYSADQLRQAYAQGAAAQLSAETVAARVWVGSYEGADHENQYVYSEDGDGEPLYTRRQA